MAFGEQFSERLIYIQQQRSRLLQNVVVLLMGSVSVFFRDGFDIREICDDKIESERLLYTQAQATEAVLAGIAK